MKLTYKGPFGAVTIADGTLMPRGKSVEVADALAKELSTTRPDEFKMGRSPSTEGLSSAGVGDERPN